MDIDPKFNNNMVNARVSFLREGPCSQGASWAVCGSGVPPYDFSNLYVWYFQHQVLNKKRLRNGSN